MAEAKKQEQAIQRVEVVREVHAPAPLADVDVLEVIERRNQLLDRILTYALRSTHPGQWVDQGGKPYPTAAGAEVMARRCAVSIRDVKCEKVMSQDDRGGFYLYRYTCVAALPGAYDSIEAVGTCSSRDQFLGTETKAGRKLSDIDEGNIMKAAYSNMEVNAITRLLGLRNLSWEQLENVGIKRGDVATVEYREGARGGGKEASRDGSLLVPYGRNKGKALAEISDADLDWSTKAAEKDVAKNDPKWGEKNKAWLEACRAELGRRANLKAGTAPKPAEATPYDRIKALLKEAGVTTPAAFTKQVTGKDHSSKVTEEDVAKVRAALEKRDGEAF